LTCDAVLSIFVQLGSKLLPNVLERMRFLYSLFFGIISEQIAPLIFSIDGIIPSFIFGSLMGEVLHTVLEFFVGAGIALSSFRVWLATASPFHTILFCFTKPGRKATCNLHRFSTSIRTNSIFALASFREPMSLTMSQTDIRSSILRQKIQDLPSFGRFVVSTAKNPATQHQS
jgi:hypothetical protein